MVRFLKLDNEPLAALAINNVAAAVDKGTLDLCDTFARNAAAGVVES